MTRAYPTPTPAPPMDCLPRVGELVRDAFDAADEPLCDGCDASFRAPDDTHCAACRAEIDSTYSDLPGAAA